MTLKLTPEMRKALDEGPGPVAVEDEKTHQVYFLVDEPTLTNLQQREDQLAIREGISDMEAGQVVTLEELDLRIRNRLASLTK